MIYDLIYFIQFLDFSNYINPTYFHCFLKFYQIDKQQHQIRFNKMGNLNSFKKDPNIDIYVELEKQFFFSGEYVEGSIYINCHADVSYNKLSLSFQGIQHAQWSQNYGKYSVTYQNTINTYKQQFILNDFHGNIAKGQYAFPFSFLLPSSISGSIYDSKNRNIRYRLQAIINPCSNQQESQSYSVIVNILEKMRNPIEPVKIQTFKTNQCCGCCLNYGQVRIGMTSNTNYLKNGDVFMLNGYINLQKCKKDIKQVKINISQHWILISSNGYVNGWDNYYTLASFSQQFRAGTTTNFQKECVVPQQIHGSTSIGSCIARFFTINLSYNIGCCAYQTEADMHIIFNALSPDIQKNQKHPPPQNWNPVYSNKIVYQNMKPFVYSPLPAIPFYHQQGMPSEIVRSVNSKQGNETFNGQSFIYKPNTNFNQICKTILNINQQDKIQSKIQTQQIRFETICQKLFDLIKIKNKLILTDYNNLINSKP